MDGISALRYWTGYETRRRKGGDGASAVSVEKLENLGVVAVACLGSCLLSGISFISLALTLSLLLLLSAVDVYEYPRLQHIKWRCTRFIQSILDRVRAEFGENVIGSSQEEEEKEEEKAWNS